MATQTQDWEDIESIDDIDDVDDTDKANDYILVYKSASGNMEYEAKPTGGGVDHVPACFRDSGSTNIVNTADTTVGLDTTDVSDANYSLSSSEITVTAAGTYFVSYSCPITDDSTSGATRCRAYTWVEGDSGGWTTFAQSRAQDYCREASQGEGLSAGFVVVIAASEKIRLRIRSSANTDISTTSGQAQLSIFRIE